MTHTRSTHSLVVTPPFYPCSYCLPTWRRQLRARGKAGAVCPVDLDHNALLPKSCDRAWIGGDPTTFPYDTRRFPISDESFFNLNLSCHMVQYPWAVRIPHLGWPDYEGATELNIENYCRYLSLMPFRPATEIGSLDNPFVPSVG